jgi:hypothetical protein
MELDGCLFGWLNYMCSICVLVKTGTLLTYRNVRTAMDVKQQTKIFVIHTHTHTHTEHGNQLSTACVPE